MNKANLRDLIAATALVIFLKLDSNHRFFSPCDLEIWPMTFRNNRAPLLCYFKLCAPFVPIGEFKLELQSGKAQSGSNSTLFRAMWPWNLTYDLKKIGHLFYATSSYVHHFVAIGEFKLELQSGNAQVGSNSMNFKSRATSKFDGWPWKTIGHIFYGTSSFVHHLVSIGDFKLDLQSGNAQFGSKSTIF